MKSFTKTLQLLVLALLLVPSLTFAQESWQWVRAFPDTTVTVGTRATHGLAVDDAGKVWVQPHYGTVNITFADTVFMNNTNTKRKDYLAHALHVYNSDGTDASFSPMTVLSNGDTLGIRYVRNDEATGRRLYESMSGRGLRASQDGKYIYVSQFDVLYKLDAATGNVEAKFTYPVATALVAVGVAGSGEVFVHPVVGDPARPLLLLNPDLTIKETILSGTTGVTRTSWATEDGNTFVIVYGGKIVKYSRADELSTFEGPEDVITTFGAEAIAYNHANGLIYANSGPGLGFTPEPPVGIRTIYGFSLEEPEVLQDSIVLGFTHPDIPDFGDGIRGLDFSPDGKTAYIGVFHYSSDMPSVYEFKLMTTSIEDEFASTSPNGYSLSQNYPNPFNPSTSINFSLGQSGYTTLKVFDMLGKEVATLVNGNMVSGNHTVQFNASNLASGTYMYIMMSNNVRLVGKMTLIK